MQVEAAYYGTPPGWIGRRVDVQWNDLVVRLLDPKTGQLLREHVRAPRGWHRIADVDRPRRTPPKIVALLEAAMRIGEQHRGAGALQCLGERKIGFLRRPLAAANACAERAVRFREGEIDGDDSRRGSAR